MVDVPSSPLLSPLQHEDATSPWKSHQCRPRWSSNTARCKPQRQESTTRLSRGVTRSSHPTSSPWKSRRVPMQGRTSRRSTAGSGNLFPQQLPLTQPWGSPRLVPIVPSSPQPSPQPEEAEHLREVWRRRPARRRSVRTPAGVEAGLAGSPGPGPAHTPARFLKCAHGRTFLKVAPGKWPALGSLALDAAGNVPGWLRSRGSCQRLCGAGDAAPCSPPQGAAPGVRLPPQPAHHPLLPSISSVKLT